MTAPQAKAKAQAQARAEVPGPATRLGRYGIWSVPPLMSAPTAQTVEALGFGAIWIGGANGDLVFIEQLLEATENIVVGTSIVNAWQYRADAVAAAYHRVAARFPGRLLLGIGIGHPEFDRPYQRPYDSVVAYLDGLDEAGVPVSDRILAALGPRMLDLAAERCVGAHPYLITPEHTDQARKRLGAAAVLAPEQKVVLDADPAQARAAARATVVDPYFKLSNYRANLREFGFSDDDMAAEGSDRVIDALVAWGDVDIVAGRLGAHLAAGAHHVAVQVLTGPDADLVTAYRRLADALFS